ncbi:unnamed protein product [Prorocentrum cordatum]|uniref:Glutaminase n=1 Tax=Prorocentrum cordatum TaxID=2364126 RepID=A0ABN9X2V1_9DINO|nr:unnamed protein product [Polarella glacialis]
MGDPGEGALVTDAFELLRDCERRQWVYHNVTGECKRHPVHAEGEWELELSEAGVPFVYIDNTECEIWLPDFLDSNVYTPRGRKMVRCTLFGPDLVAFDKYARTHSIFDSGVRFPGDDHITKFRTYRFVKEHHRQKFWWSLPTLVRKVLLPFQKGKKKWSSRVIGKRLQAWTNLAASMGLPCVRRAVAQDDRAAPLLDGEPCRCAKEPTAVTALLVAIMCTLAFKKPEAGGCASPEAAAMSKRLLTSFCARAALTCMELFFFSDCEVHPSGVTTEAARHVTLVSLRVSGLEVDATPVCDVVGPKRLKRFALAIEKATSHAAESHPLNAVPLVDFIEALLVNEVPAYKDVISAVAHGIESQLEVERAAVLQSGVPNGAPAEHLRRPPDKNLDTHEMARRNVARLHAANDKFAGALSLSVAFDGARVGCKARQNAVLALPCNFAACLGAARSQRREGRRESGGERGGSERGGRGPQQLFTELVRFWPKAPPARRQAPQAPHEVI